MVWPGVGMNWTCSLNAKSLFTICARLAATIGSTESVIQGTPDASSFSFCVQYASSRSAMTSFALGKVGSQTLLKAVAVHHVPHRPRRPRFVVADAGIDQDVVLRRLDDEALHAQHQPAADRVDECRLQPGAVLLEELLGERREEFEDVEERPLLSTTG